MNKVFNIVPISKLNRGYANEVLKQLQENKELGVVAKNNEPIAVILTIDQYNDLVTDNKEYSLLKKHRAADALKKYGKSEYIGQEDVLYRQAIDEKYQK